MRKRSIAAAVALVLATLPPASAAAAGSRDLRERARAVLSGSRFQKDLPLASGGTAGGAAPGEGSGSSATGRGEAQAPGDGAVGGAHVFWRRLLEKLGIAPQGSAKERERRGESPAGDRPEPGAPPAASPPASAIPELPDADVPLPASTLTLGNLLLFAFLSVATTLVVLWLLRRMEHRRRPDPIAAAVAAPRSEPAEVPPTPLEAARLAGLGLYGEAVHLLLLTAIERLFARSRTGAPEAETGRELVRRLASHGDARAAFAALVAASERFLFASRALGREDYEAGLADFERAVAGAGSGA